ncbi:MAG: SIS domain-containing protein [Phycisphaeraceae bacterium]
MKTAAPQSASAPSPAAYAKQDQAIVRDYFARLSDTITRLDVAAVASAIALLRQARDAGKLIFTMGNGGSASTASHMVCDLNKGASYQRDSRFRVMCLNDNFATLMAYANDVSYTSVFVEPLKNFMTPGDLVIGISGSGNSPNVLEAIDYANANGGITLGFCGYEGGKLIKAAAHHIHVPINDMQIVEDLHLVLNHVMLLALCDGAY